MAGCAGAAPRRGGGTAGGVSVRETVVFLSVYPAYVASTRLRCRQYERVFQDSGIETRFWSLLPDTDLPRWYGLSSARRMARLGVRLVRICLLPRLLRGASLLVVQREILPLRPAVLERFLARRFPLVWDVDDAIWNEHTPLTRVPRPLAMLRPSTRKYEAICRAATEVWAGSEVLAEWCRHRSSAVRVVPTVVDVPPERPTRPAGARVGWIGSPPNAGFLERVLPALAALPFPVEVVAIGATVPPVSGLTVTCLPWTPHNEAVALASISVGLYPVDRTNPLAEGKCGFKAILYMSQGIPCVVTPTATNATIVRDECEGLWAQGLADWSGQVSRLLQDRLLWERCSRAGHARARDAYSLEVWGHRLVQAVEDLLPSADRIDHGVRRPARHAGTVTDSAAMTARCAEVGGTQ